MDNSMIQTCRHRWSNSQGDVYDGKGNRCSTKPNVANRTSIDLARMTEMNWNVEVADNELGSWNRIGFSHLALFGHDRPEAQTPGRH